MKIIEMETFRKFFNREIPVEAVEEGDLLRTLLFGIGTIIEEEDKIVCKVEQEKLDEYNEIFGYIGWGELLRNIELTKKDQKDILDLAGLNKPIYYIFEGITLKKPLKLNCIYCRASAIFKKCFFEENIHLFNCVDVEFDNNIYSGGRNYLLSKCFLEASQIGKLTFKNENFTNGEFLAGIDLKWLNTIDPLFGFFMNVTNTREIEFTNTRVETYFPAAINADTIRLENSTLEGVELGLSAKSIENKDSTIKATEGVIIENQECDFVGTIDSPLVFYNGEDVTNLNSTTTLVSKQQLLRVGLIDVLNQIAEKSTRQIMEDALRQDTRGVGSIIETKPNTKVRKP